MRAGPLLLLWGAVTAVWGREGDLGEECHPSGRCYTYLAQCIDDVCSCGANVPNSKKNRCLGVVTLLNDHCEEDVQCKPKNSFCRKRSKECNCRKGFVPSKDRTRCLHERWLGDSCEETAQCQNMTECNIESQHCVCQGISYTFNGHCVIDHSGQEWVLNDITIAPSGATRELHSGLLVGLLAVLILIQDR